MKNALSFPAEIQYKAIPSKCDLKIEVWSKQEGRHQRAGAHIELFHVIWTTLAASPAPNAKIRQTVIILEKSNSDLFFYENGHISGTVRPTSLQHPSNRSSWLGRPENHLRWSLTCPGNTGEPEAPKKRAKKWLFWFFSPLKWSKTPISQFFRVTQT